MLMMDPPLLLLNEMRPLLAKKAVENIFFKKHLRQYSSTVVDELIHELNAEIAPKIDCLACANCCRNLEPGIEDNELEKLAELTGTTTELFKQLFVGFDGETLFLKTKPCAFLKEFACEIYTNRPGACKGFPHLDGKDMKYKRSLWTNYTICPIVFNVIEHLKMRLNFNHAA